MSRGNDAESFDALKSFEKYVKDHNDELDSGHWVVRLRNDDRYEGCIYYSIRQEAEECFASFTFDLYRWDRSEIRALLDAEFAKNKRMFRKGSRYSADYWLCRNPITDEESLGNDFCALKDVVCRVLDAFQEGKPECTKAISGELREARNLALPAGLSLDEIVKRIQSENLYLPAVQRGRVWNAARCATLWDSIMRGFSIGAISVKYDGKRYSLLDGQQRTAAICLGYAPYPPKKDSEGKDSRFDSILWLDVDSDYLDDCKFHFYVTTASQPWGYERSADETQNVRLKISEIKAMLANCSDGQSIQWHAQEEKPFPCELWPKTAKCPVPFSLLREFISQRPIVDGEEISLREFVDQFKDKKNSNEEEWCWNWLKNIDKGLDLKIPATIVEAIRGLNSYRLLVQDAGQVSESDVSLYFTRIGKGGVVPSNEELAYSVLKARLGTKGERFRQGIEQATETLGLDHASRLASMAVRYWLSKESKNETVYTGDVLGKIIEDSSNQKNSGEWISSMCDFVQIDGAKSESKFIELCKGVNEELTSLGYTNWHLTRYCQRHNGIVYQFLMMLHEEYRTLLKESPLSIGGVAELLCWYASDPAYVIRKMLKEHSIVEGLASAMQEKNYGTFRMTFPISWGKVSEALSSEQDSDSYPPELTDLVSDGYRNEVAYSKLIFACNKGYLDASEILRAKSVHPLFTYDRHLGVWSEDVCPWDYDHILPHSWVDDQSKVAWLVNSIGNLAPISFSQNRSLSNNPRDRTYPLIGEKDEAKLGLSQAGCCINNNNDENDDGGRIAAMGHRYEASEDWQTPFRNMVLNRFSRIYKSWYGSLFKSDEPKDGDPVLNLFLVSEDSCLGMRKNVVESLTEKYKAAEIIYASSDGKSRGHLSFRMDDVMDWYVWEWIGVSMLGDAGAREVWLSRKGKWEIGFMNLNGSYEKKSEGEYKDKDFQGVLSTVDVWDSAQCDCKTRNDNLRL